MDVDKNSTSYRVQERVSVWGWGEGCIAGEGAGDLQGKGSLLQWEGMGAEGVRMGKSDMRPEGSVSGARPHLVQLVLEHFQLRQIQLGDVDRLRHVGKEG